MFLVRRVSDDGSGCSPLLDAGTAGRKQQDEVVHNCKHLPNLFVLKWKVVKACILIFKCCSHTKYDHHCIMQHRVVNCYRTIIVLTYFFITVIQSDILEIHNFVESNYQMYINVCKHTTNSTL